MKRDIPTEKICPRFLPDFPAADHQNCFYWKVCTRANHALNRKMGRTYNETFDAYGCDGHIKLERSPCPNTGP